MITAEVARSPTMIGSSVECFGSYLKYCPPTPSQLESSPGCGSRTTVLLLMALPGVGMPLLPSE